MFVLLIHSNGVHEKTNVADDTGDLITRTVTSSCGRKVYTKLYERVAEAEDALPTYRERCAAVRTEK